MKCKLKYVLVFLKYQDEILMLNRDKPSWMGCWNGVGGKIETGEDCYQAAIRETFEETGIKIDEPKLLAKVGWSVKDDPSSLGGMYCFLKEVDNKIITPIRGSEGILDFKKINWLLCDENSGVAKNIKVFLPGMLKGDFQTYMTYYSSKFDDLKETVVEEVIEI